MRESVLELVRKGFSVLPLRSNNKIPCSAHGVNDAQNTEEYVNQTWTDKSTKNVGISCVNMLVIDVDVKNGDGLDELAEMERELGKLDPKAIVKTPSGGLHLYFRKPSDDIVGQTHIAFRGKKTQIDLRTGNQYVVAPPSVINGNSYTWEVEPSSFDNLSDLPQAWLDILPKRKVEVKKRHEPIILATVAPGDVQKVQERCWKYISKEIHPAIQGQGGQKQMFSIMNTIFNGFALSREDGFPVLMKYNEYCQPPWDMSDSQDAKWIEHSINKTLFEAKERGRILIEERIDNCPTTLAPDFLVRMFDRNIESKPVEKKVKVDRWAKDYKPKKHKSTDDNTISESFLNIPGFISDYLTLIRETSITYNKYTCFAGGLALLSMLIGPRFHYEQTRANLYLVALAHSSDGKNVPRSVNKHILNSIGKSAHLGQSFVSGEGLEDTILKHGRMLYLVDESDLLFKSIAQGKESYQRSIQINLLGLYTDASSSWLARKKAVGVKGTSELVAQVYNPFLTMLCTAPPGNYYESLDRRVAEGGLFARLVIFKGLECELHPENDNDFEKHPLCKKLIDFARLLFAIKFDQNDDSEFASRIGPVRAISMNQTPEAREIFKEFAIRASELKGEVGDDEAQRSLLGRAFENAKKYAMLYEVSRKMDVLLHCTDSYGDPDPERIADALLIDEDIATWATKFSGNIVDVQTEDFKRYFYENGHEKLNKDLLAFIRRETRGHIGAALKMNLWRKFSKYDKREIDSSLYSLISQSKIKELSDYDADGNPAWIAIEE